MLKVISLSRPKFQAKYFISGLDTLGLSNPTKNLRSVFCIYVPCVRKITTDRINYLKNHVSMTD